MTAKVNYRSKRLFFSCVKHIHIIGLGWLGMPLALKLREIGYSVSGSTRNEDTAILLSRHDIAVNAIHEQLPKGHVDVFICTIPPPKDQTTYDLHTALTKLFSQTSATVYYTSSISVYPDVEGTVVEEDALPDHPNSQLEKMYIEAQKNTVILRLGGLYGSTRHPAKYLSGRVGIEKPFAPINLISGEQVIEVIIRMLNDSVSVGTFNVVSDMHPCRKDYYSEQCQKLGIPLPEFNMEDLRLGKTVSSQKLERTIGMF